MMIFGVAVLVAAVGVVAYLYGWETGLDHGLARAARPAPSASVEWSAPVDTHPRVVFGSHCLLEFSACVNDKEPWRVIPYECDVTSIRFHYREDAEFYMNIVERSGERLCA